MEGINSEGMAAPSADIEEIDLVTDDSDDEEEESAVETEEGSSSDESDSSAESDSESESDESLSEWSDRSGEDERQTLTIEMIEADIRQRLNYARQHIVSKNHKQAEDILVNLLLHDAFDVVPKSLSKLPFLDACFGTGKRLSPVEDAYAKCNRWLARLRSKNDEQALEHLLAVLMLDANDITTWRQAALHAGRSGRLELSARLYEQVLHMRHGDVVAHEKLASLYFSMRAFDACLTSCRVVLLSQPTNQKILVLERRIHELRHEKYMRKESVSEMLASETLQKHATLRAQSTRRRTESTEFPIVPKAVPKERTWASFGSAIVQCYEEIGHKASDARPIDVSLWTQLQEEKQVDKNSVDEATNSATSTDDEMIEVDSGDDATETVAEDDTGETQSPKRNTIKTPSELVVRGVVDRLCKAVCAQLRSEKKKTRKKHREGVRKSARHIDNQDNEQEASNSATNSESAADILARRSSRNVPGYVLNDNFLVNRQQPSEEILKQLVADICDATQATSGTASTTVQHRAIADVATAYSTKKSPQWKATLDNGRPLIKEVIMRLCARPTTVMDLLEVFLHELIDDNDAWRHHSWSEELRHTFVDVYKAWRSYNTQIEAAVGDVAHMNDKHLERIARHRQWHLIYAELAQRQKTPLLERVMSELLVLRAHAELWRQSSTDEFEARHNYLLYKAATKDETRVYYLQLCLVYLTFLEPVHLPHLGEVLSKEYASELLATVVKSKTLKEVSRLFDNGQYDAVVEALEKTLSSCAMSETARRDYELVLVRALDKLNQCERLSHIWPALLMKYSRALLEDDDGEAKRSADELKNLWDGIAFLLYVARCTTSIEVQSIDEWRQLLSLLIELLCQRWTLRASDRCSVHPALIVHVVYAVCALLEEPLLSQSSYVEQWYRQGSTSRAVLPTRSLHLLHTAHEALGEKMQCCGQLSIKTATLPSVDERYEHHNVDAGAALLLTLVTDTNQHLADVRLSSAVDGQRWSRVNDDALNAVEQCFYCLYHYPNRRRRHLVEHNALAIALTWRRAAELYQFILPNESELPEFDGYTNDTINADAVQMLKRIEQLIPADARACINDVDMYKRRLNGDKGDAKWPLAYVSEESDVRNVTQELYHLIADYHFKNQEWRLAIEYYKRDLCATKQQGADSHVADSWGGLALALASTVTSLVDSESGHFNLDEVLRLSDESFHAFDRAIKHQPDHYILHCEQAQYAYNLRSMLMRFRRKLEGVDPMYRRIELLAVELLNRTERLILHMREAESERERWLAMYFLGKVAEKRCHPINEILRWYIKAAHKLQADGAKYPDKIRYTRKDLAFEALEIHYRVHVVMLKALAAGDVPLRQLHYMYTVARVFREHGCVRAEYRTDRLKANWFGNRFSTGETLRALVEKVVERVGEGVPLRSESDWVEERRKQVLAYCIDALRLCIKRYNCYYKAYYRLAWVYTHMREIDTLLNMNERQAFAQAECILLDGGAKAQLAQSLFWQRKQSNVFEGIYQLPSEDIERPGTLAMHMERCMRLAIDVCGNTRSVRKLLNLAIALARTPDADKRFVSHSVREELAEYAITLAYATSREELRRVRQFQAHDQLRQSATILDRLILAVADALPHLTSSENVDQDQWQHLLERACRRRLTAQGFAAPNSMTSAHINTIIESLRKQHEERMAQNAAAAPTTLKGRRKRQQQKQAQLMSASQQAPLELTLSASQALDRTDKQLDDEPITPKRPKNDDAVLVCID